MKPLPRLAGAARSPVVRLALGRGFGEDPPPGRPSRPCFITPGPPPQARPPSEATRAFSAAAAALVRVRGRARVRVRVSFRVRDRVRLRVRVRG